MTETEIKERPILFSTPMVKAILDGRKTVTRRVINPQPELGRPWKNWIIDPEKMDLPGAFSPYGITGDVLWVRESFVMEKYFNGLTENCFPQYKADYDGPVSWNWKPSIHMPKHACRLRLEVFSVRVERLHDITEEDAKREGAPMYVPGHGIVTNDDIISDPGYLNYISYKMGFEHLWYEINGKESWDSNPWVWRIEFKKI